MKKAAKKLFSFALCVLFCGVFCLFSSALSTNEYGLGLSATSQENDGMATVKLNLKNSNNFDVNDIKITHNIPDGLALQHNGDILPPHDGSIGYQLGADTLAAGDIYEAELVFASVDSVASDPVEATIVKKGNEKAVIAAIAAVILIITIVAVLVIRHKKTAAMLLAIVMLVPVMGVFGVHAVGAEELRSFTLEDSISLGGKTYPLSITVSYQANTAKNSYFEFETAEEKNETPQTVDRLTTDFSGTATANGTVSTVTYSITSKATGNTKNGEAELEGCEWNIDKLALTPGENEVVIKAELVGGETQEKVYNLNYDRGTFYQPRENEAVEENGVKYIRNLINIYFEDGVDTARMNDILDENNLVRIGEINSIFLVQARANAANLDELNKKCQELMAYDEVCLAITENILNIETDSVPNDPWYYTDSYKYSWSEKVPDGNNWGVEAVEALSAWEYESYFGKVQAGIVDSGVLTTHEDFDQGLIVFPNSTYQNSNTPDNHGTHVSGIIGATRNNGKGGSGLLSNVEIYSVGFSSTATSIINAAVVDIEHDAKAVNISIGLAKINDGVNNPYEMVLSDLELASYGGPCAVALNKLLNQGKEFVVVQSAGNGTLDTRFTDFATYRSDDAVQNGLFCSVKTDGYKYPYYYGSLTKSQIQQVYDRIIVVGGVRNYSSGSVGAKFKMFYIQDAISGTIYLSNGGDRVDIYAPGYNIFSTIPDQVQNNFTYKYGSMTGTSQAAPFVTAIAAMCFSINPDFTGKQVKELICDDANSTHVALDYSEINATCGLDYHPFEGDGKLVSMKLVAEAALRTVCEKADYRFFNQMVSAAQSLNPSDFKNFEVVQSVLDGITPDFYNLYEFQQDQVTDKAMELADAMDKLEERGQADYSDVEKAKAEAAALNKADYVDFSGVTSAVNAVVYGKYADEQAEVDAMAKAIRDAISALVPLANIISDNYDIIADNTNRVVVFTADYIDLYQESLTASGGYSISFSPNSAGTYSTGATATLSKEGYSDIVYTVAVLGDVDGNAKADANDAFLARMYALGMLSEPDGVYFIAADADCNGEINEEDSMLIQESAIFNAVIFNDYIPGE